jgi:hypothetical protein
MTLINVTTTQPRQGSATQLLEAGKKRSIFLTVKTFKYGLVRYHHRLSLLISIYLKPLDQVIDFTL